MAADVAIFPPSPLPLSPTVAFPLPLLLPHPKIDPLGVSLMQSMESSVSPFSALSPSFSLSLFLTSSVPLPISSFPSTIHVWSDLLQIRSVLSSAYSCDWIVGVDAMQVLVSVMFRWLHMFVEMAIRALCRLGFCTKISTDGASMRIRRVLGGSGYGYGSGGRSDECYLGGSGGDCEVCGFHQDWRRSFSPESFRLGMFSANED